MNIQEFKQILRNMKKGNYIKIGFRTFYKTNTGKFCVDGKDIKTAVSQKMICYCEENEILKNNFKVLNY